MQPIPIASAPSHHRANSLSFSPSSPATSFSPTTPSPILSSALNFSSSLNNTNSSFLGTSPPLAINRSIHHRSFSTASAVKPVSLGAGPGKDCQWASAWAIGINGGGAGIYGGSAVVDDEEDIFPESVGGLPVFSGGQSSLPLSSSPTNPTGMAAPAPTGPVTFGSAPAKVASQKPLGSGAPPGTASTSLRVSIAQPSQESHQRGQNVLRRLSLGSGSILRQPNSAQQPTSASTPFSPPNSSMPTTAVSYSFPNSTPGSAPSVQFTNPLPANVNNESSGLSFSVGTRGRARKGSVGGRGGKRAISPHGERMLAGHAGGNMF